MDSINNYRRNIMELLFTCLNHNCSYPGKNNFEMTIDEETVMDNKNMATIFCPFCKKEMEPAASDRQPSVADG